MYPVPIETLRVRVGLDSADASRDDDINYASDLSLMLMGSYCDRLFDQVVDSEEVFTHESGYSFSLIRYPIVSIKSVTGDSQTITAYHIAKNRGIIELDSRGIFHELTIVSTGGYAEGEFPADLLQAYYLIFDQQFAGIGTTSTDAGAISSVTVADVGTVRYDTVNVGQLDLPEVGDYEILDNYKRYKC